MEKAGDKNGSHFILRQHLGQRCGRWQNKGEADGEVRPRRCCPISGVRNPSELPTLSTSNNTKAGEHAEANVYSQRCETSRARRWRPGQD